MSNNLKISYIEYSPATNSLDVFMCGCTAPHCKDCYNEELWDFNAEGISSDECWKEVVKLNHRFDSLIDRILILGGEPFDVYNKYPNNFLSFISNVKTIINKPIYLFTRYNLCDIPDNLKQYFDYIKCGRYIPELATDDNIQEGIKLATSNQIIYKQGVDY